MYTSHGYHIPGTIPSGPQPEPTVRCGGVRMCKKCQEEAANSESSMVKNVPVKYNGVVIGEATVQATGRIDMTLDGSVAQELVNVLSVGIGDSFSIDPNYIPKPSLPRD